MKAYFDRNEPFYLSRVPTFDGVSVFVEETVLKNCEDLVALLNRIEAAIDAASAPETSNQYLCDTWAEGLKLICKTRKQDNTRETRNG